MQKPIEGLVAVAQRQQKAHLVIKNAEVYNVFTKTFRLAEVAIYGGYIAAIGAGYHGEEEVDAQGALLLPGFVDGHVHIESGMAMPQEYARTLVALGTTTIIADPHEIANVAGIAGIEYMLEATENAPINAYFMLPSCVPASPLEMGGHTLEAADLAHLLAHPRVLGLAEMMNYPGVLAGDAGVMAKLRMAEGLPIDGHAPALKGDALQAYAAAGIRSDHECLLPEEAQARLENGMAVMLREGSATRNLLSLLAVVNDATVPYCFFATDDRHPEDLEQRGHINHMVRLAQEDGRVSLPNILNMACFNAARHFGLRDIGAIAPGYRADLALFPKNSNWRPSHVWKGGTLAAHNGKALGTCRAVDESAVRGTMHLPPLGPQHLRVPATSNKARVIGTITEQVVTQKLVMELPQQAGCFMPDPASDVAKIAVFERHRGSGNVGVAFIRGLGLQQGAVASTIAHDSHNLVVVGMDDASMLLAAEELQRIGGGLAIACEGRVVASLPLPLAGLLSDMPMPELTQSLKAMHRAVRELGLAKGNDPFMTLAFMSLPVIPHLKITERGLVDVDAFTVVPVSVDS